MYIRRSITDLPPRLREPIVLYFFENMPQPEIATHLNISPANVRKRLQRARTLLRGQIAPYVRGEPRVVWTESESGTPSTTPLTARRDMGSRVPQGDETITSRVVAIRSVRITLPDGIERYVYLALDHKPTRQCQKVKTLRAYVQRHPTSWRKQVQLAHILYTMGHWEEASAVYCQMLQRRPRNLVERLRLGHMLHLLQRDDEAITVYQDTLALTDRRATQHYVEGCVAACRQQLEAAIRSFTASSAIEPHNVSHWQALGLTHLQAGQPIEALQAFEKALHVNADDLVALTYSYAPLVAMGRDEEAKSLVARTVQLDSGNVLALTRLATLCCRMRWVRGEAGAKTKALLQRAGKVAAENPKVHASIALYHIARGEQNQGLALLQKFTAQHPYCPDGWYYYALWCFRTGALQNAAEAIMQAYALDQNHAAIYQVACDVLPSVGRLKDARDLLEEMLRCFPGCWSVWATAGRILVEKFQDEKTACTVSAHAPRLHPIYPRHGYTMGVLALAGKHQDAVAALEQGWQLLAAMEGNTFAAQAAAWLGESYHCLGENAKSQTWWEISLGRAYSLNCLDLAMGHYWQGKAYAALGQRANAWKAYHAACHHHLLHPPRLEVKHILQPVNDPSLSPIHA